MLGVGIARRVRGHPRFHGELGQGRDMCGSLAQTWDWTGRAFVPVQDLIAQLFYSFLTPLIRSG
jgi:hypothetical protein